MKKIHVLLKYRCTELLQTITSYIIKEYQNLKKTTNTIIQMN